MLEPGMRLTLTDTRGHSVTTTTGVCVLDRTGDKYMTVASRGVDMYSPIVLQDASTRVGTHEKDISCAGIGLAKPNWGQCFIHIPEASPSASPDATGHVPGHIMAKSIEYHDGNYVSYIWIWIVQRELSPAQMILPERMSGSPVYLLDGTVVGFFQYYISAGDWNGYAVAVSATELSKRGYALMTDSY
ncbi:hypothetical protein M426DRAFT_11328 [Hypoxylon sp. CI-4A]|nr:hypothetical protein M426DRAFT_11328 [Hypoxylon sp. CI-4A]